MKSTAGTKLAGLLAAAAAAEPFVKTN